mgnify:CR=1 FL=1
MSKKTADEIKQQFTNAEKLVEVGKRYQHYKDTDATALYKVTNLVLNESDQTILVIYEALYDPFEGIEFARPLKSFTEQVELDGQKFKRFTCID